MGRLRFLSGSARRWRAVTHGALPAACLVLTTGCTSNASGPLLTDPHEIVLKAIRSTAALSYVRVHAEIGVSMVAFGGPGAAGDLRIGMDADVDLAHRQLAGRMTTQGSAGFGAGAGGQPAQVQEFISLANASYQRSGGTGRWTKFSTGGIGALAGPSNAQIAAMVEAFASDPGVKLDLGEAASCSLGTCYHLTATVDGNAAFKALMTAFGAPADANAGLALPPIALDLLVDQATGVLSQVQFQTSVQGASVQLAAVFSNPDLVVQIVAPPAALVDDLTVGPGFGGGQGPAPTPAISLGPGESP